MIRIAGRNGGGALALLLLCGLFSTVLAQTTAQLSGTVKDQTGAVLPGAEVTMIQNDTGLTRMTVTDETGSYVLTSLPIGPYRFEASLPGFRTYVQTGIVLQVNSNPSVNAVLEVGQVSDQIEVEANAALVETRNTGVGQVLDNQRVLELPLNGRQVTELILLSGVATVGGANGSSNGQNNYPTTPISIAGGMGNGVTYLLDGGIHNNAYGNLSLPMPFPDALQEFRVETSGLAAQYGYHSAGVMNAVTKAGGNDLHGSLFEFVRNGVFNARDPFALTRDELKRNQFGGTVGGAIVRNKLFYFAAHQTTTERSAPSTSRAFIPTPAMVAGDFTAVSSAACNNGRQVTLRAPFTGNRIDPRSFSAAALNVVKALPINTILNECGEVRYGAPERSNEHLTVGRIDYQWNDKHSIFGRYFQARRETPANYDGVNGLTLTHAQLVQHIYSFVLGDTYLIGNGIVSSFRGNVNRELDQRINPQLPVSLASLGIKTYDPFPGIFKIQVTNGFDFTTAGVTPGHYNSTPFQLSEDLSLLRGAHQAGFGVSYIHNNFNTSSGQSSNGQFMFNGQTAGTGLADFMLGKPSLWQQSQDNSSNPRQHYIGLYVQDTWKANSRLTVNAGLRWEPYLPAFNISGNVVHFERAAFDKGVRSTVYKNAPVGLQFPGDPDTPGNKYTHNSWLHFAPRLGLAWDPNGNGRMTVRAAGGLFFDLTHLWTYSGMGSNPPFGGLVTLQPPGGFDNPWIDYPGGNPFPYALSKDATFPEYGTYMSVRKHAHAPYVYQWNLSLQKQLWTNWLVSSNYIGNSVLHMQSGVNANPVIYLPGSSCVLNGRTFTPCSSTANFNERRILNLQNPTEGQFYGTITDVEDGATANYNGLLLSVQRRRSNGMTVQGNYTWSHCIGDPGNFQPGIGTSALYPDRRWFERGNCSGERRHVVNLSTVYETPQFSNDAVRALAGGWQISAIVRLQSGSYFTVVSGFDTALVSAIGNNRANQVLADVYAPEKNSTQWLNPAAFSRPADGQWGNAANSFQGPGSITINMGLTRKFQIRESQSVEFRAEAFNAPNHVNPGSPNTTLNNQNFGKILSGGEPRVLQMALKYVFFRPLLRNAL